MKKVGVILARLQPVHKGHLALIEKSIKENDETYIFVGSADKFNERNPIPIGLRIQLLRGAIEESFPDFQWRDAYNNYGDGQRTITIVPLDDLSDESQNDHEWGFYLYSNIVSASGSANFTMYYSDGFEIITSWFPGFILRNNVSLNLIARNTMEEGISATVVRNAIENNDIGILQKYVTKNVIDLRETIAQHIKISHMIKV